MERRNHKTCLHGTLSVDSAPYASKVGYRRPTEQQRVFATKLQSTGKSKSKVDSPVSPHAFPTPLILPGDDLSIDPKYPAQSLRQWMHEEDRNAVTLARNVVYVAAPPEFDPQVAFMRTWTSPAIAPSGSPSTVAVKPPQIVDVVDYLKAYYHGITVKMLPPNLKFSSWHSDAAKSKSKAQKSSPRYVGLNIATECVRIRTRASHDSIFARQINLDDLLDAAISTLPEDAYALLLLVDCDLFENAEDDFVCGRAYGGSRVAVISSARYNPSLDSSQDLDRDHAWPASHCETYIKACQAAESAPPPRKRAKVQKDDEVSSRPPPHIREDNTSPLREALSAHQSCPSFHLSPTPATLNGLWLGRVCKTAAHELGHCFGMDHCVYYACSMQGSASLKEDASQPPYLCPIDLEKMLSATGATSIERYKAIQKFCLSHKDIHLFDAFNAWIDRRLKEFKP